MTKPFIPHVFRVLTTSAVRGRTDPRTAVVSFPVDADFYSFVLDRAAPGAAGSADRTGVARDTAT